MQVRPITGQPRPRFHFWRRLVLAVLRWSFIVLGAVTAASVLFSHLYSVNETIYDPSSFAIGVAGLFAMMCGVMLMVMSRNSRLRAGAAQRQGALRGAGRLHLGAEGGRGARRQPARSAGRPDRAPRQRRPHHLRQRRVLRARRASRATRCAAPRLTLPVLEQGEIRVMPDGTRMHDQKIETADGPRWLAWREAVVFMEASGSAEVQSVGRDVTERTETGRALAEARDAAEAANRAKSRFLAMVSHEIRTPLNGILGMTDLLLDTPLTPEQTAYIKAAKTSGDALLSLIEEILDFSKIEAGKLDLEPRPFALLPLVEEIVELLGPRAQAKGLEIASDVDERLPERVMGDATRLRQVLLNLAGNAIKFTESRRRQRHRRAGRGTPTRSCSRCATPASASRPSSRRASSSSSSRPKAAPAASSAARASASRSRGASSSAWAAASRSRARRARARRSASRCRCRASRRGAGVRRARARRQGRADRRAAIARSLAAGAAADALGRRR